MSVVFQRSTGKMTAEMFSVLSLTFLCFQGISGIPFSQVYVRSSSEGFPLGYVSYGAPPVSLTDSQMSEISVSPVVPSVVATCVTPCVVPASNLDVTPSKSTSKANVLTYNSDASNTPVVLAPNNDERSSYEYSYVVYDENTGDQKEQRELSDGSVVQGQYSFLQPDGFVREVKYTADDLKGFKAVVRKFWPTFDNTDSKSKEKSNDLLALCNELKNEKLKEAAKDDTKKTDTTQEPLTIATPVPPASELLLPSSPATSSSSTTQKTSEKPATELPIREEQPEETPTTAVSKKPVTEKTTLKPKNADSTESEKIENSETTPKPSDTKAPSDKGTSESSSTNTSQPTTEPTKGEVGNISITSGIATYSDIVRCLQKAFEEAKKSAEATNTSLTYIILPSKRC